MSAAIYNVHYVYTAANGKIAKGYGVVVAETGEAAEAGFRALHVDSEHGTYKITKVIVDVLNWSRVSV